MQAAAHTPGGFGGVSQKVGKEFVAGGIPKNLPERVKSKAEKMYAGGAVKAKLLRGSLGLAEGGMIEHVSGGPIGKDDGLIAAQRGEYVVRKDAVKKLGKDTLEEINKGRLPTKSERLYRRSHG